MIIATIITVITPVMLLCKGNVNYTMSIIQCEFMWKLLLLFKNAFTILHVEITFTIVELLKLSITINFSIYKKNNT